MLFPDEATKKTVKKTTSLILAGALVYEQVLGHSDEHIDPETHCPEPQQVRPAVTTVINTTTTTAPPGQYYAIQ